MSHWKALRVKKIFFIIISVNKIAMLNSRKLKQKKLFRDFCLAFNVWWITKVSLVEVFKKHR